MSSPYQNSSIQKVPPIRVKRPMQTLHNDTKAYKKAKLNVPTAELSSASRPSSSDVRNDVKNMANLETVERQADTILDDTFMRVGIQVMMEKLRRQDEIFAKQKAKFEAKVQMQDEVIAKQKAAFEAKIQMQDEVIAKQKAMFEAKTQMVEVAKLQHEKLMSLIIKSKIAELKVKIESRNPGHEVIHSTGVDIGSVLELIPESLRVKLEARFSLMYEGFKCLFLTHFDDSQWEKIESELKKEYLGFLD